MINTAKNYIENYIACVQLPTLPKKKSERSVCDLPLVFVFRNNFAYIIKWSMLTKICVAHISLELDSQNGGQWGTL